MEHLLSFAICWVMTSVKIKEKWKINNKVKEKRYSCQQQHLHSYTYTGTFTHTRFFHPLHLFLHTSSSLRVKTDKYTYKHICISQIINFLPRFMVVRVSIRGSPEMTNWNAIPADPGRLRPVFRYERTSSRIPRLYREPGNYGYEIRSATFCSFSSMR